ncbi:MAG: ankyrin repeat domain-containing protein [Pyrinomonadaceae bacterium]
MQPQSWAPSVPPNVLSHAKNTNVPGRATDSECAKREEFKRQFLADLANRVDRSALMRASAAGRIRTVRTLLKRRVAVNKKDAIGITALMLAAEAEHVEVVKALLAAGADPNAVGGIAHGPIFSVMTMAMNSQNKNWMEVIDTLIAGGARMNPAGGFPVFPLVYAIEGCDLVMITALLKRGADVNWNRGKPLVAAVTNGCVRVKLNVSPAAKGTKTNCDRDCPIMWSWRSSDTLARRCSRLTGISDGKH